MIKGYKICGNPIFTFYQLQSTKHIFFQGAYVSRLKIINPLPYVFTPSKMGLWRPIVCEGGRIGYTDDPPPSLIY